MNDFAFLGAVSLRVPVDPIFQRDMSFRTANWLKADTLRCIGILLVFIPIFTEGDYPHVFFKPPFLAWLFSKKTSRYCHILGVGGVQKL